MSAPRYMGEKPYPESVCGSCRWYAFWTAEFDGECNAPQYTERTGFMSRGMQRNPDEACTINPAEWEKRIS